MRRLYLLRHAKSSWDDPMLADHDRPLAPRGRAAAKLIAGYLNREGIRPELVLCSSSVRTRQTLEAIRPALGKGTTVRFEDVLYGASADEMLRLLQRVPDEVSSAMLIGHNPGMQDLALALAAGGERFEDIAVKFPTAALASLAISGGPWSKLAPGRAEVSAYVVARDLQEG